MTEREQEVLDALEYRVAQLEDRVWAEANAIDTKALHKRRSLYYRLVNALVGV
jgi:hypothetical protein